MTTLGIDGGGTHLRGCLNSNNRYENFEINTGVNLTSSKKEDIKIVFENMFLKTTNVEKINVSFSGAGTTERKKFLFNIIEEVYNISNINIYSDAEAVLMACPRTNCTIAICGTGSIIMAKKDNLFFRNGGWGHLFGDNGSGYWLSMRIFQEAFNYYDGIIENDIIFEKLKKYYSVKSIIELSEIQKHSAFKTEIASFSKILLKTKSKLTSKVIEEGTDYLSEKIIFLSNKVNSNYVYLHGGVFNSDRYFDLLNKKLKNYSVEHAPQNISYFMSNI